MKIHKFNPIKKKDTLLAKLFIAVAGVFAGLLLIFGGMVISEIVLQPETAFEAPPPPEKVEKKRQIPIQTQKQQQPTNKLIKRIQLPQTKATNVSTANIALPSSDIGGGTSLVGGLAPKGLGDLKITMTPINLLGMGGNTEKVVIVIDASRHMMTEEKGALYTYNVIKNDIKRLIGTLPPTVLFNVIAFNVPPPPADGIAINAFNPSGLISASEDNKAKLISWLDPINAKTTGIGVKNNYSLKYPFLPQAPTAARRVKGGYDADVSKLYRVYQAALEQGADTIFILTSGWTAPNAIKRPWTDAEKDAYAKKVAKAKAAFDERVKAAKENKAPVSAEQKAAQNAKDKAAQEARAKSNAAALEKAKNWIATENAKRAKAGQSLYVEMTAQKLAEAKFGFKKGRVVAHGPVFTPPPQGDNEPYSGAAILKYYRDMISKKTGEAPKTPVLNMILFRGKKENIEKQTSIAEAWTKLHNGKVSVLVGTEL